MDDAVDVLLKYDESKREDDVVVTVLADEKG